MFYILSTLLLQYAECVNNTSDLDAACRPLRCRDGSATVSLPAAADRGPARPAAVRSPAPPPAGGNKIKISL